MNKILMELNTLEETLERWLLELEFHGALKENSSETVPVSDSLDRVTASPVFAKHPSPSFYAASADGLAVLSSKTFSATLQNPLRFQIGSDAKYVDTGSLMPEGTDAVIPIEKVKFLSVKEVEINRALAPWENVRPMGEEVSAEELILPTHHKIRPLDIVAMLTGQVSTVDVVKKPRIGIIPVGSSFVPVGTKPQAGKIIETSSQIISKSAKKYCCESIVFDIVPENIEDILKATKNHIKEVDLLVIIAGPSQKTEPVAKIIDVAGELVAFGIQVKPGMSSCCGIIEGTPVLGLSCYGMSTFIMFELLGLPIISKKLGIKACERKSVQARLAHEIQSPAGVDEFIRVSLARIGDGLVAAPISRGANILMSLVRADGITRISQSQTSLKSGESVKVNLLREDEAFTNKVLISGTYDLCFDILRNELQKKYHDVTLFSSNTGSMKGLQSLSQGFCHISSIHIFDKETGEYNIPLVKKILADMPLILVNLFHRRLGLLIPRGNPKNINTLEDLTRDDVKIVNRIRGAGTRMVFDFNLKKNNIDPKQIQGYENEVHTHLNLASAIASGNADTGLGILEAARATGLDFIPLIPERLDFVVPKKYLNFYPVRSILQVIDSPEFKNEITSMGGYDTAATGKIIFER